MTAEVILNEALTRLGYIDSEGEPRTEEYAKVGLSAVNAICTELHYAENEEDNAPLESLSDEVNVSTRYIREILPNGVAMLVAQSEGDSEHQRMFAECYNSKLSALNHFEPRAMSSLGVVL